MEENRRKPRQIEENPYLRNQITFYASWYKNAQDFREAGDEVSELDFYRGIMAAHFEGTLPPMSDEAYERVKDYLPSIQTAAAKSRAALSRMSKKGGAPRGNKNAKREPQDEEFETKKREALDKLKDC